MAAAIEWYRWWFLLGPLLGACWLLLMGLLLRWTFSRRGSLAGASRRPAAPHEYGHLRPLRRFANEQEGERIRRELAAHGVRSTTANTAEGWFVMVWAQDLARAREIVGSD